MEKTEMPSSHKILPKIEEKLSKRTPSAYAEEMLQSSEERLAKTKEMDPPRILELLDMANTTFHTLSSVDMDQALFQPFPTKLIFQNFTERETYKLPLRLFNTDKVPRHVRLEHLESQIFAVAGPEGATSKVAPGLSAAFTVVFTPQHNMDYHHELVFVTERERFEVPLVAIGPRAILDFRDELLSPVCPVKATTEKTHLVRNIGTLAAGFKLHTKKPFSVEPALGSLEVGESLQVTITFCPLTVGEHMQELLLHYHTGEVIYITLSGICEELDIQLESNTVHLKKTFISMFSKQTVSLTNTTNLPLRYRWSTLPRQRAQAGREGPLSSAVQDDMVTDFMNEGAITFHPMEGEIWPKVTQEFTIIFKPRADTLYQQTLYCHITGRESPLCLTIKGEGMGPHLVPSYNLMDMRNVFIGDNDEYEVTLTNKGLIPAPFQVSSFDTTFGRCFSFSPVEGVVQPQAFQVVTINFSSPVLGPFSEDLLVTTKGQPQPLNLNFRGCVIAPTFNFNVKELNFGDVAFGVPQTVMVTLSNTSFVPMTFSLHVLGDGSGPPSVTCAQQVEDVSRKQWQCPTDSHLRPKEFTVIPQRDTVSAMSQVTIKVTLCSNTVRRYKMTLAVDVKDVGKEMKTLAINARCVVPHLEVAPAVVDYQSCFLDILYEQKVQLLNTTSLPVCFGILDQEFEENPSLLIESSILRGVIPSHSSLDLPVCVKAKAVGGLRSVLRIAVFGSGHLPQEVVLSCNGQGPIVHPEYTHLDFGRIPVLTDIPKSLCLLNHSPIPAIISVCMKERKSFWRVEPTAGEVPPGGKLDLQVVAHLKDTLDFEDQVQVCVQDFVTLTVAVQGRGTGCPIVSDKTFAPSVDLGTQFSHGVCNYRFKLTNLGLRTHRMYWRPSNQGLLPPIVPPKTKLQQPLTGSKASPSAEGGPVFTLSPSRVELFPGQSVDMVLAGACQSPKEVHERLVCRSIVGNTGSSDIIMNVDITCCFVAPRLSISPKQLEFYSEKAISSQYKKLKIQNISTFTLSMHLETAEPFSLCDGNDTQLGDATKALVLDEGKQAELWVCFNPSFCKDRVSKMITEFIFIKCHGHPQTDSVKLHGEIFFPNLSFSSTVVDFGFVLNSAQSHRNVTITNCSPLPVTYHWTLEVQTSSLRKPKEHSVSLEDDGKHMNEVKVLSSASLAPFRPSSPNDNQRTTDCSTKEDEMLDALPSFGALQPGEQQVTTFNFYGGTSISYEGVARCHVEEGPVYEVTLTAKASHMSFSLDPTSVNFGSQMIGGVTETDILLRNTGDLGFNFSIWNPDRKETKGNHLEHNLILNDNAQRDGDVDDQLLVFPPKGFVEAADKVCLSVSYIPDALGPFGKRLHLQVDCLPLQEINVVGEGVRHRFKLDSTQDCVVAPVTDATEQTVEPNGHQEDFTEELRTGGEPDAGHVPTLLCESLAQLQSASFQQTELSSSSHAHPITPGQLVHF